MVICLLLLFSTVNAFENNPVISIEHCIFEGPFCPRESGVFSKNNEKMTITLTVSTVQVGEKWIITNLTFPCFGKIFTNREIVSESVTVTTVEYKTDPINGLFLCIQYETFDQVIIIKQTKNDVNVVIVDWDGYGKYFTKNKIFTIVRTAIGDNSFGYLDNDKFIFIQKIPTPRLNTPQ